MQTFSLFELNEHVKRVLALNFPESIWITAEVSQINQSKGHHYLELVEKDTTSNEILAQTQAVIWLSHLRKMRRQLGASLHQLMQAGITIRIKAQVEFHERYGLKLIIEEIDPAYTLGQLEVERRKTISQLKELNLLNRNAHLPLPIVLQKIAIFSSPDAAGYHDFINQINQNQYGYVYQLELFQMAVQGIKVEEDFLKQLERLQSRIDEFDCLVLIRGGGSRLDLAPFDGFELSKAIAETPIPVLTGIGHEIDEAVADQVAHKSLKTPTAVAEFLINQNAQFESRLVQLLQMVQHNSLQQLWQQQQMLQQIEKTLPYYALQKITEQEKSLIQLSTILPLLSRGLLNQATQELEALAQMAQLLGPEQTFARGYTITIKDGQPLKSKSALKPGDEITTQFKDGEVVSKVE